MIGPRSVLVEFPCKNKTQANKVGRLHARQKELRFIGIVEPDLKMQIKKMENFNLNNYDTYIVFFSGGKDSIACFLHLLESGIDRSKIELWHHEVDGREKTFLDWEVTTAYVESFAKAFNVPVYYSYKQGGLRREILRENSLSAPIVFEDQNKNLITVGGLVGKKTTRRKFPQLSADLSVRFCSVYGKINVATASLINQKRFENSRTLVLSGERGEESAARAKYEIFETHHADNRKKEPYTLTSSHTSSKGMHYTISRLISPGEKDRHIDHYRPIRDWKEAEVWNLIKKYRVRVHPAYFLGVGRVSCKICIFSDKDQAATVAMISPQQVAEVVAMEKEFHVTIRRDKSWPEHIARGTPYPEAQNETLVKLATSSTYTLAIILSPEENWVFPPGAFKHSCGPT